MRSTAATVEAYLAELPPDRRAALSTVRKAILEHLDPEYAEGMSYGMITYFVPLSLYPPGYHANPSMGLPIVSLASQKNYMSLYLMGVYCGCAPGEKSNALAEANRRKFQEDWARTGKKLDMGKSCIRFQRVEDLALDVIGRAIERLPARTYIEIYESVLGRRQAAGEAKPGKPPKKRAKKFPAKKTKVRKTPQKSVESSRTRATRPAARKKSARKKQA